MRLSDKQEKILKIIDDEGAISIEEARGIYRDHTNFYRSIQSMESRDIVESRPAPGTATYRKVWVLTDKGEALMPLIRE